MALTHLTTAATAAATQQPAKPLPAGVQLPPKPGKAEFNAAAESAKQAAANRKKLAGVKRAASRAALRARDATLAALPKGASAQQIASALHLSISKALLESMTAARATGLNRLAKELGAKGGAMGPKLLVSEAQRLIDGARANFYGKRYAAHWLNAAAEVGTEHAATATTYELKRIAITESSRAFTDARSKAVAKGEAGGEKLYKSWDSAFDACPTCASYEAMTVPANGTFPQGEPGTIHPFCLCSWTLVTMPGAAGEDVDEETSLLPPEPGEAVAEIAEEPVAAAEEAAPDAFGEAAEEAAAPEEDEAEEPAPEEEESDEGRILGEKISDAKGSNPGGVYMGTDDIERYVKFYQDPSQALGEHLANQIYADMGMGEVKSTTFEHNGKIAYASEIIKGLETFESMGGALTKEMARKALGGFVADILTANWDAAGLTLDNMALTKGGKIVRVDNGAAFLTRAQGARKPVSLLNKITELEGFFNAAVNPAYARLAKIAGVNGAADLLPEMQHGLERIQRIKDQPGGWPAYVDKHAPGFNPQDRNTVVDMLEMRSMELEDAIARLKEPKPVEKPPAIRKLEDLSEGSTKETTTLPGGRTDADHVALLKSLDRTSEQGRVAIDAYSGSDYGPMRGTQSMTREEWANKFSSHGLGESDYDRFAAKAALLEAEIKANAVATDTGIRQVFRGMSVTPEDLSRMLNSPEMAIEAVSSTSRTMRTAVSFADARPGNVAVVFSLKLKGAEGTLSIEHISRCPQEREILLAKGKRFRAVKWERVKITGEDAALIHFEEI